MFIFSPENIPLSCCLFLQLKNHADGPLENGTNVKPPISHQLQTEGMIIMCCVSMYVVILMIIALSFSLSVNEYLFMVQARGIQIRENVRNMGAQVLEQMVRSAYNVNGTGTKRYEEQRTDLILLPIEHPVSGDVISSGSEGITSF